MGNKPQKSHFQSVLPPLPQSYIQSSQQTPILQHPQLPQIRPYIMLLNTDQQNTCIDSLNFRKQHKQQFIQILYGEVMKCQKEYRKIKVYTEHIVICLQNLINVHFSDLVPVFYWVFRGFKLLVGKFGMFVPDPRMIGFNQNGEVKVWCNIKYTRSKPQISYSQLDQEKMVEMLIQIFSSKIDISSIPIDTQRRKFHINAKNFDEAIKFIESQVQSVQLIPRNIRGIVNLMQAGRKIKQSQIISMSSEYYNKDLDKTIKFQYSDPDPNAKPKPKINFSFNGQSASSMATGQTTPKKIRNSTSLPKITFSTGTPTTPSTTPKQPQNTEKSDRPQQKSRVQLSTKIEKPSPISINISIPAQTSMTNSSQKSKNKINFNFVSNPGVDVKIGNNGASLQKNKGRSTSLIKFTYQ